MYENNNEHEIYLRNRVDAIYDLVGGLPCREHRNKIENLEKTIDKGKDRAWGVVLSILTMIAKYGIVILLSVGAWEKYYG